MIPRKLPGSPRPRRSSSSPQRRHRRVAGTEHGDRVGAGEGVVTTLNGPATSRTVRRIPNTTG
jgi:hypothetical protein